MPFLTLANQTEDDNILCAVPPAYYAHLIAFRARYYIEGDTSYRASASSGTMSQAGGGGGNEVRALPVIKDNVKAVMFYC